MKKVYALLLGAIIASTVVAGFARTPDLPSCDEWVPACSSNYTASSRPSSYAINYVVIHKIEGPAAGGAEWMQDCSAAASAHYIFNNTSGYCYQMVLESNIAWHAGNWDYNCHSVGIEHGGYTANNDIATACYDESALETKSCIVYYGVPWNRSHIIGHSEVPGCPNPGGGGASCHTDPGSYWNWTYYMSKCNPNPVVAQTYINDSPAASATWATGTSSADKYGTNYKWHSTAASSDPASWTINVASSGNYNIAAWWPADTNRSNGAPYILPNGSTVYENQQLHGGQWNTLTSSISLSSGNNITKLSYWAGTGYVVVADAIKYHGPN